jgi:hypothetical protein
LKWKEENTNTVIEKETVYSRARFCRNERDYDIEELISGAELFWKRGENMELEETH